jgi:hypothetical protein
MIRIFVLALCLVSSPISAETGTTDIASSKRLASELQVCNAYFMNVSFCFADKSLLRKLRKEAGMMVGSKAAKELSHIYTEQGGRAGKNAYEIGEVIGMPAADLTAIFTRTLTGMQDEIAEDCTKIGTLIDRYASACKQLVENPGLRLKRLSECTNERKVGC